MLRCCPERFTVTGRGGAPNFLRLTVGGAQAYGDGICGSGFGGSSGVSGPFGSVSGTSGEPGSG
jgi:hypothetical protein